MGNNHSTGFDLNLIICGRPSYNDVSILFGNEKNIISTEIEIKGKKHSIKVNKNLNWKFFIFPDNFNNETKNNLFFLIENLCDINEKKNVLICYLNLNESKNLIEKFQFLNENFLPFFIFITNDFEKSELLTTNFNFLEKQKNSTDFNKNSIDSNLIFTTKPSETFPTILHICSYYNELGDSFCIPEFNQNSTEKKQISTEKISIFNINFMICGESGVGKSKLINILLNEKKSLSGINFSTKKIIKYNHKHLNLSFYDTPGFIMGKSDEVKVCIEKINELQNGLSEEKNEIHVILYLINSQSGRTLKGIEIDFLRFLVDLNVKIYFVLTKVVEENKQFKKEMENSIEFLFKDKKEVCNKLKEKIFMVDLNTKRGLVALLSDLYGEFYFSKIEIDVFNDEINNENNKNLNEKNKNSIENNNEINENNENNNENNNKNNEINNKNENEIYSENKEKLNHLKTLVSHSIFFKHLKTKSDFLLRKKALAYSLILSYALGNFICNSNTISLGDSKSFVCSSLQIAMISSISLLYKKKISKSQISKKTIESLGIHISDDKIKIIIREIVNFIRYLPYFGEIINNIINGSLSGISTFVIGYNLVKKYEREVKINYEMNLFLEAIESFNEAVEGIKKLKERIYFETN